MTVFWDILGYLSLIITPIWCQKTKAQISKDFIQKHVLVILGNLRLWSTPIPQY